MSEPDPPGPLGGRRIAIAESRALDLFAALLERRGAIVERHPLVGIRDAPDPAPVLAWLRDFAAGRCDALVLMTGEGLQRLLDLAQRHDPALRAAVGARLARLPIYARGPKPGRVLRTLGLQPAAVAEPATTEGMIALLAGLPLRGQRIGLQLYGDYANPPLQAALHAAGAEPLPVAPYVYVDACADAEVVALIDALQQPDRLDAIAFTSLQQVRRLFEVAASTGRGEALRAALERHVVGAVGPLVAQALADQGITAAAVPEGGYFLKPLTRALERALASG
jgi:Uroporphyrinogen-III synthase